MIGKIFRINMILALVCGLIVVTANQALSAGPIAVLLSDDEEAYTRPVAAFINEVDVPVEVFNLQGDISRNPNLANEIFSRNPSLIFTLGAKAAYAAKLWTRNRPVVPVVFAMVLNWKKYGFHVGQDNITGIAMEVEPGTQFANMALFSPDVRRLGVIYSAAHSAEIIGKARDAARLLGLQLVEKKIRHSSEFRNAYKRLADRIDGFWVLSDPVTFTLTNISWLEKRCVKDRLVCIAQSENVAKIGIMVGVNQDYSNIGTQAASIAKNILAGRQSPAEIGVMPPLGTDLYLNMKTASKIGLVIDRSALDMASEVIY